MARNIILILLLGFGAIDLASQTTDFTLRRFGALSVTEPEVAQITDLVIDTGKRLWLLRTPRSMIADTRFADLFLAPDLVSAGVQRGRGLSLIADGQPFAAPRSPWRIKETFSYAYVPTRGRQAGDIGSDRDVDWPFMIRGDLDDATLVSIVEFVRLQPRLPNVPEGQGPDRVSRAPISGIYRQDDVMLVGLRTGEHTGETVWIGGKQGQWVITKFQWWIA